MSNNCHDISMCLVQTTIDYIHEPLLYILTLVLNLVDFPIL